MKISETWIPVTEKTPELTYSAVYTEVEDGAISREWESGYVLVLSEEGERGIAFYNEYCLKGEEGVRAVWYGFWFRTDTDENGTLNAPAEREVLSGVYAWQPIPEV